MKYKSYGNSVEEFEDGLGAEFITSNDFISARTVNRPINNLYENQEESYKLLQTLTKTIYGNYSGIIPDILEEFYDGFSAVGSYKNNTQNYYLRIPTGFLFGRNKSLEDVGSNDGNPFSKKGEHDYKDEINKSNFTQDNWHNYVINNQPNVSLYERQLANLIQLDLTDLTNDIKVYYDMIPAAKRIPVLDEETGFQKYDSLGNPMYEMEEDTVTYKYEKDSDGNIVYEKDENGNIRHRIGYYVNVVRATSAEDEEVWLPNKSKNSSWKFVLPAINDSETEFQNHTYNLTIKSKNEVVEVVEFIVKGNVSEETANQLLFSEINTNSSKLTAKRFTVALSQDIKNGVEIICNSSDFEKTDYYTATLRIDGNIVGNLFGGKLIENVEAYKKTQQRYYDNIFQTTNAFVSYFSSYLTKTESINNYVSLEPTIEIKNSSYLNILVYDTSANINNKLEAFYDKTGKYKLITVPKDITYELDSNGVITGYNIDKKKLLDIDIASFAKLSPEFSKETMIPLIAYVFKKENKSPNRIEILDSRPVFDIMDRRLITTKRAELNTLESNTRTDLINYINIRDSINSRSLEITEDQEVRDNNQTRLTSPILRLVDEKNDSIGNKNKQVNSWEDSKNGDTPSDFFEESTPVKNLETGEVTYTYHKDFVNQGLIIDKSKGVKLFSNAQNKPVDISSSKGNINIFTYNINNDGTENVNYKNNRINIRNTHDYSTNMVDILGITRIRSKNNGQLVIRKIGNVDTNGNESSIQFTIGNSYSKNNTTALTTKSDGDVYVGNIAFDTDTNKNRMFHLRLSDSNASTPLETLTVRVGNTTAGNYNRKIFTYYGNLNPVYDEMYDIGSGKDSRTYTNNEDDSINQEGRWLNLFVKNGYFGKINLADRTSDINNADDANAGVLNLGNSNIYNISSIYVNRDKSSSRTNLSTINFLNDSDTLNTILSNNTDGISLVLNRSKGTSPSCDTENENNSNGASIYVKPTGTEIRKKLWVKRQAFINNHNSSSTEDNSALVVKGQSVLKGEVVIGKNAATVSSGENANGIITSNKSNDYKEYNEEFEKISNGNKVKSEDTLYMLRLSGRSHFSGDITLDENSKFTENTTFNKALVIKNKNYNDFDYNQDNSSVCLPSNPKYIKNTIANNYYTNNNLPRNITSLKVESGTILFGNDNNTVADTSDLLLNGSQWIKRRLSIGSNTNLINTYMQSGSLLKYQNESPSFYVNGASQFAGDVVFGHLISDDSNYKYLTKSKLTSSDGKYKPIKAVFWGENKAVSGNNLYTDFDFHGKTWLDGNVYIGNTSANTYASNGNGTATLTINGGNDVNSLILNGALKITNGGSSMFAGKNFKFTTTNNTFDLNDNVTLNANNNILLKSKKSSSANNGTFILTNTTANLYIEESSDKSEISLNKDKATISNNASKIEISNKEKTINIVDTETSKIEIKENSITATNKSNSISLTSGTDNNGIKLNANNNYIEVSDSSESVNAFAKKSILLNAKSGSTANYVGSSLQLNDLTNNKSSKIISGSSSLEINEKDKIIKLTNGNASGTIVFGGVTDKLLETISLKNTKVIDLVFSDKIKFNSSTKFFMSKDADLNIKSLKVGSNGSSSSWSIDQNGNTKILKLNINDKASIDSDGSTKLVTLNVNDKASIDKDGNISANSLNVSKEITADNATSGSVSGNELDVTGMLKANSVNITEKITTKDLTSNTINIPIINISGGISDSNIYGNKLNIQEGGTLKDSTIDLTTTSKGLANNSENAGLITSSGSIGNSNIYGNTINGANVNNSSIDLTSFSNGTVNSKSGEIKFTGSIENKSTVYGSSLAIQSGSTMSNSSIDLTSFSNGAVNNKSGAITIGGEISGGTISASELKNNGTISGAEITVSKDLTNNSGGEITGTVSSDGENTIYSTTIGSDTLTNKGTISSAEITVTNDLENSSDGETSGKISGGTIGSGTLKNSGAITNAEITVTNDLTNNSGGEITGTVNSDGENTIYSTTISSNTLKNSGTISSAEIAVTKDLENSSGGEITGTVSSDGENTIYSTTISSNTLKNSGTITNAEIAVTGAIENNNTTGLISDSEISAGSISNASKISDSIINLSSGSISGGSISGGEISGGSLSVTNGIVNASLSISGEVKAGSLSSTVGETLSIEGGSLTISGSLSSAGGKTKIKVSDGISINSISSDSSTSITGSSADIEIMSGGAASTTGDITVATMSGGAASTTGDITVTAMSGGNIELRGDTSTMTISEIKGKASVMSNDKILVKEMTGGSVMSSGYVTVDSVIDGKVFIQDGQSIEINSVNNGTITSKQGYYSNVIINSLNDNATVTSTTGKLYIGSMSSSASAEASGDITVAEMSGGTVEKLDGVSINNMSGGTITPHNNEMVKIETMSGGTIEGVFKPGDNVYYGGTNVKEMTGGAVESRYIEIDRANGDIRLTGEIVKLGSYFLLIEE